ncbi:MAG: F0F1 ATP synthase subunit epsilon [Candidatus Aminicenantaceae bacterium]
MSEAAPPSLRLRVITSHKLLAEEEVQEVTLPSLDGYVGIFPGHRPLMLALGRGELVFRASGREERFSVDGGYAEVRPDLVLIFTELLKGEPDGPQTG